GLKGKVRKLAMARLFGRIERIHTVTEDATRNFSEFFPGVRAERLKPILHGVDTDFFSQGEPADLRFELGISASTPLIGFFGRFMGQKGFRTLVDAMLAIKQEGIEPLPRVLTFGWGGFIREDYEYLTSLGLADEFDQMPGTDNMPSMIKAVDMVVIPSRWEACGLLAMEVLSAGVPLLSTDCIGLREVVAGSPTRIFPPGSAEGLSLAIKSEVADPSKDRFLDYQQTAIARFHIGRPASELRALYDELTGQAS
uniref:glycosyltransferase family 4 protein n=1 Tax=Marinobacter sp. TaxID=50741 RepID=UPI003A91F472